MMRGTARLLSFGASAVLALQATLARPVAGQGDGQVFDSETGAAVAGATLIWSFGGETSAHGCGSDSHSAGEQVIAVVRDGRFAVSPQWGPSACALVRAPGYRERAVAWDEGARAGWQIALVPDPLLLDEVVAGAHGQSDRRSSLAVPTATLGAERIAALGAASVDRALAWVPGLETGVGAPTGSEVRIRGIGGARVLVLVDGHPAPGALIENRDLSRVSTTGVQRIEIVKGPLSSSYGSDALAGVVNVVTRAPEPGFRIFGRARWGGLGRRGAELSAGGGGRLRGVATAGWRQEDRVPGPFGAGAGVESPGPLARVWDLRTRAEYEATARWRLGAGVTFLRERQRWPVGGGFNGFNDNRALSGWFEARLNGRAADGGDDAAGSWTSTLFVQDYEHLYRSARGDNPVASPNQDPQREREARLTSSYSVSLGKHALVVGAEGARRAVRSPDKLIEEQVADRQAALFVRDQLEIGGAVVTAGSRLGWNSRWGTHLSPSVGVTRPLGRRLRLRANIARGFRAPSFKELAWNFANLGAGYVIQGSADLLPESSWSASGGLEWTPTSAVVASAELYSNEIDDLIELALVGHTPAGLSIYSPRNLSAVAVQGFEVALRAVTGAGAFSAGYAFLDARSGDSGTQLNRRSRHSGQVRGMWVVDSPVGARLDAGVRIVGEAPIVGIGGMSTEVQERFASVDAQLAVDLWARLALSVGADNLLDARPEGWQSLVGRRFRVGVVLLRPRTPPQPHPKTRH